jgi:hypothetical protein
MNVPFYRSSNEWFQQPFAGLIKLSKPGGQLILLQGTSLTLLESNKETHNEFSLFPQKYFTYKMSLTILKAQNKTHLV